VSAGLLYLLTAAAIMVVWRRWVQPMTAAAALALLLLPLCFTGRAVLTGGIYAPIDLPYMSEPLRAYGHDYGIEHVHNGTLSDIAFQVIPWRKAERWALAHGEWPLWNPFISCGQILAAGAQPAVFDPLNLISLAAPLGPSLTFLATMAYFLAALFTFAFIRELNLPEDAALVAAAGWMLCGSLAFFVHWSHGRAWIYLPLVLLSTRRAVHRPGMRSGAMLMAALTLLILAGHPETVLHVVATGAAYGVFELVGLRKQMIAVIATAVAAGSLALLLCAIYLMPFLEALPQSSWYEIRRDLYAPTSFFTNPDVLRRRALNTFLPFYGGQPARGLATPDYDPETARCGSVVMSLAALAVVNARRRRETWFFLLLGAAAFCATIELWPVAHFLHWLPLFDLALNQRLAFVASFCLAVLAAIAIGAPEGKPLRASAVILIVAVFVSLGAVVVWRHQSELGVDRRWMREVMAVELFPLIVMAALMAARVRRSILVPTVLGLLLVQRIVADGSIYPVLPERVFYPRVPLLQAIRTGGEPFRVIGKDFAFIANSSTLYELEDARGYDLPFDRLAGVSIFYSVPQRVSFNVIPDLANPFLPFLNVRYAITPAAAQPPEGWRIVMEDRGAKLMESSRVLPRAFVPRRIRYDRSDQAVRTAMKRASDFSELAWVIVQGYKPQEISNGPGKVLTRRVGSRLRLTANMQGDGWVVISETAWPGWRAYLDDRRVQIHYANHAFLGVFVPKGEHDIRLVYLPESFTRGRNVSLSTMAALIMVALWRTRSTRWRSATGDKRRTDRQYLPR
jgi:hypothetical protein